MNFQENKDLVSRFTQEVMNDGNLGALGDYHPRVGVCRVPRPQCSRALSAPEPIKAPAQPGAARSIALLW